MNKLQRITDFIATLEAQLSAVEKAMSVRGFLTRDQSDALGKLSLELRGKLEDSRSEARIS